MYAEEIWFWMVLIGLCISIIFFGLVLGWFKTGQSNVWSVVGSINVLIFLTMALKEAMTKNKDTKDGE